MPCTTHTAAALLLFLVVPGILSSASGLGPCPADEHTECPAWAQIGECLANPFFMRQACKASCLVVPHCALQSMGTEATRSMGPWMGHATPAGTTAWATGASEVLGGRPAAGHFRHHPVSYSGVDKAPGSLSLSSLGVGTYLGGSDARTDEDVTSAIIRTVSQYRWNVIDTAANYREGQAEVSVGRALQALRWHGGAQREDLFISTKAGFPRPGMFERLLQEGKIRQADVADGYHCMHPNCIQDSLKHSLAAMGVGTVDLLYLHNPAESQQELVGREAFMQGLRAAFKQLEESRSQGLVKAYGIASWSCFRVPPSDPGHLSLQSVVELAKEVGGVDHAFRYIQLPVNARMPEAWAEPWQELGDGSSGGTEGGSKGSCSGGASEGGGSGGTRGSDVCRTQYVTVMEAAQKLGVGVFGSGPFMQAHLLKDRGLARAAAAVPQLHSIQGAAPQLLQVARSTPGLLTALVGQKAQEHVEANGALTRAAPLSDADFRAAFEGLTSS